MHAIDIVILLVVVVLLLFALRGALKHFGGKGGCCGCSGCSEGCGITPEEAEKVGAQTLSFSDMEAAHGGGIQKTLYITGMECSTCKASVESALSGTDGVKAVDVDLASGTAKVLLSREISDGALRTAVENKGFKVKTIK